MSKSVLLAFSVTLLTGVMVHSADAPPKPKLSEVAPAENLVLAADKKIADLEKLLANADSIGKSEKKKLKRDAGILGVIAQVIAEHDQTTAWQKSAPDVRDAAKKLAAAKSPGDAKQLLETLQKVQKGEPQGAAHDADWATLIDFDSLMSEVRRRNSGVGRAARKMRRGLDEKARNAAARDAEILALLGMVTEADASFLEDEADIPQWRQYSVDQRESSIKLAAALRAGDGAALKAAYSKFKKSCTGCHKAFRD